MRTRPPKKLLLVLIPLLSFGVFLGACVPTENNDPVPGEANAEPGTPVSWTIDGDCSVCHQKEGDTMDNATCLAGTHATEQAATCVTCHGDESTLQAVHENAPTEAVEVKRLKKSEVNDDTCLDCHSLTDLAEKTAGSTTLTDHNGTVENPHAIPNTLGHADVGTCASCHKGHDTTSVEETASEYCFSCHHHEVYECGTCH